MDTLEDLTIQLQNAKATEKAAVDARIAVEDRIVALVGKKEEGSQTHTAENGIKVTVTAVLNRKMDWAKWALIKDTIPPSLHPVKLKEELDDRGVKYLQSNEPEIYNLLPITVTPGKTRVELKVAS